MLKTALSLVLGAVSQVSCKETFSEELKVMRLHNDFNLLTFAYDFAIDASPQFYEKQTRQNVEQINHFPRYILELAREVETLESFELDMVKGRWNQNFVPRVQGYQTDVTGV